MSSTSVPDTLPTPALQPPAPHRGMGTVRNMVISMVVILAAVVAWFLMVPRPSEIVQPAVDVTSVAIHVRQETSWAISAPQLPAGWKATNVRFAAAGDGLRTWHAGYLSPAGQCPQGEGQEARCYVSVDQTRAATDAWVAVQTSHGRLEGTILVAGTSWQRLSSPDILQRSLVSMGAGGEELSTVVSGTASYAQLAQFAEALEAVPAS